MEYKKNNYYGLEKKRLLISIKISTILYEKIIKINSIKYNNI